jgi:hypothetical protein
MIVPPSGLYQKRIEKAKQCSAAGGAIWQGVHRRAAAGQGLARTPQMGSVPLNAEATSGQFVADGPRGKQRLWQRWPESQPGIQGSNEKLQKIL